MEQRRLRLGDIVDDYCPRERRLTNHAVVAMIGDDIKQTRCTTCDAEHSYKEAKVPPRRKRKDTAAPVPQVLEERPKAPQLVSDEEPPAARVVPPAPPASPPAAALEPPVAAAAAPPVAAGVPDVAESVREEPDEPVHRHRLIRATLPRPDGQRDVRTPPDFTVRLPGARVGVNGGRPGNVARPHGKGASGRKPHGKPRGARHDVFAHSSSSSQRQHTDAGGNRSRNRRGPSGNKKRSR